MADSGPERSADLVLCPSAPARPGALLLGVIGPSGNVAYLPSGPVVDASMLERLAADGPVTQHYRLASPCLTNGCIYWAQGRCHVPDTVRHDRDLAGLPPPAADQTLPACAIRPACRWWLQDGAEACKLCPLVTTRGSRPGTAKDSSSPEPTPGDRAPTDPLPVRDVGMSG